MDLFAHGLRTIEGRATTLAEWRGQVLLIVNTASQCGFTPQYAGLQALHDRYAARGFSVLGFPCNQFGAQEPGGEAEIRGFCQTRFGVTFPLFGKVEVNGAGAHPLWRDLKRAKPGLLGTTRIKWNFTKFLLDREARVRERFAPTDKPEMIAAKVEALL